jgi:uncharacterized protein YrrD
MLINGANIIGAKVITKDKKQIDTVRDIVFNQKSKRLDAFLLYRKEKALLFKDAKNINTNQISIDSEKVLKNSDDVILNNSKKNYYATTQVVSEKGEAYGFFKDVFFDMEKGIVSQIAVNSKKEMPDNALLLINVSDIKKFGDDAIVVRQRVKNSKKNSDGILKNAQK